MGASAKRSDRNDNLLIAGQAGKLAAVRLNPKSVNWKKKKQVTFCSGSGARTITRRVQVGLSDNNAKINYGPVASQQFMTAGSYTK